jgi:hypothetical protein
MNADKIDNIIRPNKKSFIYVLLTIIILFIVNKLTNLPTKNIDPKRKKLKRNILAAKIIFVKIPK